MNAINRFFDENGDSPLPGFDGEWEFHPRQGIFNPNSQIQQSSQSDEWYTEPEIVELTRTLFGGKIDLDPMSCEVANTVVKAATYYTAEIDGLTRPWFGNILWNPPWGGGENSPKVRGVKKLMDAYYAGDVKAAVCVFNIGVLTTKWFQPLQAGAWCVPPRRMKHWTPKPVTTTPNSGTVIVYIGNNPDEFGRVFSGMGRIMIPWSE